MSLGFWACLGNSALYALWFIYLVQLGASELSNLRCMSELHAALVLWFRAHSGASVDSGQFHLQGRHGVVAKLLLLNYPFNPKHYGPGYR